MLHESLPLLSFVKKRFDCIVMNPPFGRGSEATSSYLDENYTSWCNNLICAFFDRMQEMLMENGKLGAIFDRTVMIKSSYEKFRQGNLCGYITHCADTGWGVLDASVETSTLVLNNKKTIKDGCFFDILDIVAEAKDASLRSMLSDLSLNYKPSSVHIVSSGKFENLPNTIIGYYFNDSVYLYLINRL